MGKVKRGTEGGDPQPLQLARKGWGSIKKEIEDFNIINKLYVKDIWRTLLPTKEEFTFLSGAHKTFLYG